MFDSDSKPSAPSPWAGPKPKLAPSSHALDSTAFLGDAKAAAPGGGPPPLAGGGNVAPLAMWADAGSGHTGGGGGGGGGDDSGGGGGSDESGGGWRGVAKGAGIGAGIGTLVLGPFGTIMGGIIGGVAGGLLGGGSDAKPSTPATEPKPTEPEKAKITDADRKQAEVARDGLGKALEKIDLPAAKRDMILAQTKGMSGDALVQHMRILEHAMKSGNADRALGAYADINKMASADFQNGGRITADVLSALVGGVADRRTDSERGQEGILGAKQAREATEALLKMSDGDFKRTSELLEKAGKDQDGKSKDGADAGAEKALLMQALASRRDDFKSGDAKKVQQDMDDLAAFAGDIRGTERKELIRTTTAIDVDDVNTSEWKPNGMMGGDKNVDNDGLFQRYTQSCGPTTAQMTKAAADPIYARALHKSGLTDPKLGNQASKEQKDILERLGGNDGKKDEAISRFGNRARVDFGIDAKKLLKDGSLSDADFKALRAYTDGKPVAKGKEGDLNKALEKMRAANDGRPTEEEMQAMRDNATHKEGNGMYLTDALNDHAKGATHVNYSPHDAQDAKGKIDGGAMDNWAEKLADGQDVPLRVGWKDGGGHFMACTDVRGKGDDRKFLISDPWTGKTSWVPEKSIKDGSWTKTFEAGPGSLTDLYY
jgi:hypothetical protein